MKKRAIRSRTRLVERRLKKFERRITWLETQTHNLFFMYREHKDDTSISLGKINTAMEQRLGGVVEDSTLGRGPLTDKQPISNPLPFHEQLHRAGVAGFVLPGWDCCDDNGDLYPIGPEPEPEGAEHGESTDRRESL